MKRTEWEIGLSIRDTGERNLQALAQGGIDCFEVSDIGREDALQWKEIRRAAQRCGVKIHSFHLPFGADTDISLCDNAARRRALSRQIELMQRAAQDAQVSLFVIHPSYEPIAPSERAQRLARAAESLHTMAQAAKAVGGRIAVENLPRTCLGNCSRELSELLAADDHLGICFDTNHLLTERNTDFIRAVGKHILTTHISDYDFLNERHWLPGEGKNHWEEILSLLEEDGYAGAFLYELGLTAPETIIRRDMTPRDIRENADALLFARPFPLRGIPVPQSTTSPDFIYYHTAQID